MKALTLWRPWDEPVACGAKAVENRSWPPPPWAIGLHIAIHASKVYDDAGAIFVGQRGYPVLPRATSNALRSGCVVGAVTVRTAFHRTSPEPIWEDPHWREVLRSPWFVGPWGWLLEGAVPLPRPVPCRGAQGLWTLPPDVEAAVRAQLTVVV